MSAKVTHQIGLNLCGGKSKVKYCSMNRGIINDLQREEFELKKTSQKEFRIENIIRTKG